MNSDSLDRYREPVLGILKRQDETGSHISEAEAGRELGIDPTEVGSLLHKLQRDGLVRRTANGNWELEAAQAEKVTARPDPKEPRQA